MPETSIVRTPVFESFTRVVSSLFTIVLVFNTQAGAVVFAQVENSDETSKLIRLGNVKTKKIVESSGLAICSSQPNSIWTINDSGNAAEVYLISTTGDLLVTIVLKSTSNKDWEAMCEAQIGGESYLIVGDVGDNNGTRKTCSLLVFPQPKFLPGKLVPGKDMVANVKPNEIRFQYSDGPRNCEAISFDAASNSIWLIEKQYVDRRYAQPPGIYKLPIQLDSSKETITAERIGDFPVKNVTGMAFSTDKTKLIIRNYLNAHLFHRQPDQTWQQAIKEKAKIVVLPLQRQGEAVCFTSDSKAIIVTSEKKRQPIWQINLDPPEKSGPPKGD